MNTASPIASPALQLSKLTLSAGGRDLLVDCSLTIPAGEITVIVGSSGAGKSVLLRTLAGLLPRRGAAIQWSGQISSSTPPCDTPDHHGDADRPETEPPSVAPQATSSPPSRRSRRAGGRVGVVFQQFALFDELSPRANVQFAIDHRQDPARPPLQSADQWLAELRVPGTTPIAGLSGGQKQRLAIARTLAAEPDVLLYDEPTSGLDAASGRQVANLIRQTQSTHRRTSIVVTHDYETLLPIADSVLLFDAAAKRLVPIPKADWPRVPDRMRPLILEPGEQARPTPLRRVVGGLDRFLLATSSAIVKSVRLPLDLTPRLPSLRWGGRFSAHYLRLVGGPTACVYLILAGVIVGFTGTYFTFKFLPFKLYTQPLLIDELLGSIGFALYRVLVPVLATVLVAARCGAAVAADVGVKQYGGQIDALKTLGVPPRAYLLLPIVLAFLIATPVLEMIAFQAAKWVSVITFTLMQSPTAPTVMGPDFWHQHFFRHLRPADASGGSSALWQLPPGWQPLLGWYWVVGKSVVCGFGTGVIGFYRGFAPKQSARDVSDSITSTVLWTTLYVLVVHFVFALLEF